VLTGASEPKSYPLKNAKSRFRGADHPKQNARGQRDPEQRAQAELEAGHDGYSREPMTARKATKPRNEVTAWLLVGRWFIDAVYVKRNLPSCPNNT